MTCRDVRSRLSLYLDSAVSGAEMQSISAHLGGCAACKSEFAGLAQTQKLVSRLAPHKAPADLAVRLKVAISHEMSMTPARRMRSWMLQAEHAFNSFMLPATAGVLSSVIFFGMLIGFFALHAPLVAAEDVPTALYMPPQLQSTPFAVDIGTHSEEDVIVETYVDAQGRVLDYRILSGPQDSQELKTRLDRMMIFAQFSPARSFGLPTSGRVVLSFSKVQVQG